MHMASDRRQFNQALRRWDALHEKGAYSLPVDEGGVAILCSGYGLGEPDQKTQEVQAFEAEAKRIADLVYSRGIDVAEFYDFDEHDMIQVLTDRTFSSVITIGNGNLSETYGYGGRRHRLAIRLAGKRSPEARTLHYAPLRPSNT